MDLILIMIILVLVFGGGFGYRRWGMAAASVSAVFR
jgi:hypothetical protein